MLKSAIDRWRERRRARRAVRAEYKARALERQHISDPKVPTRLWMSGRVFSAIGEL